MEKKWPKPLVWAKSCTEEQWLDVNRKRISPCIMQSSPSSSHLVIIIIGPYPFKFVSHGNNGGRMYDSASFSFGACGFSLLSVLGEPERVFFIKLVWTWHCKFHFETISWWSSPHAFLRNKQKKETSTGHHQILLPFQIGNLLYNPKDCIIKYNKNGAMFDKASLSAPMGKLLLKGTLARWLVTVNRWQTSAD